MSSTGQTRPDKMLFLDLKAGRHVGKINDSHLGLTFLLFLLHRMALGETGETVELVKGGLWEHKFWDSGFQQPYKNTWSGGTCL